VIYQIRFFRAVMREIIQRFINVGLLRERLRLTPGLPGIELKLV